MATLSPSLSFSSYFLGKHGSLHRKKSAQATCEVGISSWAPANLMELSRVSADGLNVQQMYWPIGSSLLPGQKALSYQFGDLDDMGQQPWVAVSPNSWTMAWGLGSHGWLSLREGIKFCK